MTAETNGKAAARAPGAVTDGGGLGAQLGLMLRAFDDPLFAVFAQ